MKQLLIVKSTGTINAGTYPNLLNSLNYGDIELVDLGKPGTASSQYTFLNAAPTNNFSIAVGRGNHSPALVIPEVDYKTLSVTKTPPTLGVSFTGQFSILSAPVSGSTYTVVLIKKGTVPHERNTWTVTETIPIGVTVTQQQLAEKFRNAFRDLADSGLPIRVAGTAYVVAITSLNKKDDWELRLNSDSTFATPQITPRVPTIGDAAYVKDLALQCAAGKGFNYLEGDGKEIYPGYPEEIENLTPNKTVEQAQTVPSSSGYAIYTLRFQVGRASAKTRDEKVWQLVHIAVPVENETVTQKLDTIFGTGTQTSEPVGG